MKKDVGFATIYFKKSDKEIKNAIKTAKIAYKLNRRFYGQDVPKFKIKFFYSRKAFNKEWGGKTRPWMVGFSNAKRVALFPNKLIKKFSLIRQNVKSVLLHEINHVFFSNVFNIHAAKPLWIFEGLALVVGNHKLTEKEFNLLKKGFHLPYTLKTASDNFYAASYLAVKYLIKTHGLKKIFFLLRRYSKNQTRSEFEKLFKRIFKTEFVGFEKFLNEAFKSRS